MTLNWKVRGNGRHDALASRVVGGKYYIRWTEQLCFGFDESVQPAEQRNFDVRYQYKGGGSRYISCIRTLAKAKALCETHHTKRSGLICRYGNERSVPQEAWDQFSRELLEWERGMAEIEA